MAKVIITFEDNPMKGLPGQADFTSIVSSDPPLPLPPSEENLKKLTPAQMAAIAAVAHIAHLAYETAWVHISQGSD